MLKRIFSIFAISLIITGLFFDGYSLKCPVYADSTIDQWTQVTTNEQLADAFRSYCKSRDLTIEGSVADAVTSFTTKAFIGLCNTLGIDLTALQAQVKYQTDGNLGLRFLFTTTGIDAYNRIFAQFLQDNELEVGDNVDSKNIFNGSAIGNTILWELVGANNTGYAFGYKLFTSNNYDSVISYRGGSYVYGNLLSHTNTEPLVFNTFNLSVPTYYITGRVSNNVTSVNGYSINNSAAAGHTNMFSGSYTILGKNIEITQSYCAIGKNVTNNHIIIFLYFEQSEDTNGNGLGARVLADYAPTNENVINNVQNFNVNVTTNNKTINNNNYEGDTIINNEGDIINNNPDPDPDTPTPDPPTLPDDGGWQDWQLPNMPNDWLIYGMEKKFPFDIPFNIMFGLSLLNHEPEIPKFEGDIDLKVCTWHYDIDLTPFDGIAQILRKFEVLAFIIGLAILTKELIMWG